MAVAAIELNIWTPGRAANRLHVQLVVQFYGAVVAVALFRRVEIGMAVLKAANAGRKVCLAALQSQVRVAGGAGLIGGSGEIDFAAMFDVTFGAVGCAGLFGVMDGAIMAGKARGVFGFGTEAAGLLNVTGGALRFEHGVRFTESAAGIHTRVPRGEVVRDPDECDKEKQ